MPRTPVRRVGASIKLVEPTVSSGERIPHPLSLVSLLFRWGWGQHRGWLWTPQGQNEHCLALRSTVRVALGSWAQSVCTAKYSWVPQVSASCPAENCKLSEPSKYSSWRCCTEGSLGWNSQQGRFQSLLQTWDWIQFNSVTNTEWDDQGWPGHITWPVLNKQPVSSGFAYQIFPSLLMWNYFILNTNKASGSTPPLSPNSYLIL